MTSSKKKCVVLFSGGLDSTVVLYYAKMMYDDVEALTIDYGQINVAELKAAERICIDAGIPTHVTMVTDLGKMLPSVLTGFKDESGLNGRSEFNVPGRNIFLLTLAAVYAAKAGIKDVLWGAVKEQDGSPDTRPQFIGLMKQTLNAAQLNTNILTPFLHYTKADVIKTADRLPGCWAALADTVTCYKPQRCGRLLYCLACELRMRAFQEAGLNDPAR